ncbi:unnamed protein product [Dicrocoelium dendriticum]|nr:unnamed protein product [Dicrocoelium dendriticum]
MVMERLLRKFNGNPVTKKKYNSSPHGSYPLYTFGAPLKDVIDRDKSEIPLIVTNVFDFLINHRGLEAEGVFRVNGNSRTVDILKHLIDENGSHWSLSELSEMATELERSVDVYSVASLLKLYLRELPDGLIPARVTPSFLEVFQGNKEDKQKCLYQLERLIGRLPVANYTLLQHLCQFLHTVWTHREVNKMSVEALGIVFGPNVFQLHRDSEGIHEQGAVNRIMTLLIENSGYFFRMTAPSFANVTSDIVATDRLLHPISDVKNPKKSRSVLTRVCSTQYSDGRFCSPDHSEFRYRQAADLDGLLNDTPFDHSCGSQWGYIRVAQSRLLTVQWHHC